MRDTRHPTLDLIDGIPAQQMLGGLANLHHSVVVTDTRGVVLWASRGFESLCTETGHPAGQDLATVCNRYLDDRDPAARLPSESAATSSIEPPSEFPRSSQQIREILRQLERRGSLFHYRFEAEGRSPNETELEINAFRVDSHGTGIERDQPREEVVPLYVVILRPAPKHEQTHSLKEDVSGFYKDVLDRLPEAILTIDPSGFITYANARVVSLLGVSHGELLDTPISRVLPSSAIPQVHQPNDPEIESVERNSIRLTPSGAPGIDLEVTSRNLDLPDGRSAGRIVQLRDTTSERHIAGRFRQKVASLESYVHQVSHDLRSPLVSLLGFTKLMKQDYETVLDESGRKFLDRIEQAGSNMNALTRDLLEQSTQESPKLGAGWVDPRPILLKTQTELKRQLEERGTQLLLPDAPPMVQCDPTQLAQIFSTLIGNALAHMGPCDRPQIRVEIYPGAGQRTLVVRDNGRGIDRDDPGPGFDGLPTHSSGGGLATVERIVQSHGGRFWVDNEPGCGAAFYVSLESI